MVEVKQSIPGKWAIPFSGVKIPLGCFTFKVIVKTGCRESKILGFDSAKIAYKVELKARPVEGKANKELIKFLSKELGRAVRIKTGFASREKIVEVIN